MQLQTQLNFEHFSKILFLALVLIGHRGPRVDEMIIRNMITSLITLRMENGYKEVGEPREQQ